MRPKYIVLTVALSISVASIARSADEPATPATQPATPATTPAAQPAAPAAPSGLAAASSTSTPAKAPAKETATADTSKISEADATAEKHLLASGYKKKTHNGVTVYCRKEMPLGSRFETERCGSAQDMELQAQQARDLMNSSRMSQGSRTN